MDRSTQMLTTGRIPLKSVVEFAVQQIEDTGMLRQFLDRLKVKRRLIENCERTNKKEQQ